MTLEKRSRPPLTTDCRWKRYKQGSSLRSPKLVIRANGKMSIVAVSHEDGAGRIKCKNVSGKD